MNSIGDILNESDKSFIDKLVDKNTDDNSFTVNSKNNSFLEEDTVNGNNKSISTVNSRYRLTVDEKIDEILQEAKITPEGVAQMLAEGLDDKNSLTYYIILAKEIPQARLFDALGLTKEVAREGKIRTNKAIYFQAILRRWGFKTKFINS